MALNQWSSWLSWYYLQKHSYLSHHRLNWKPQATLSMPNWPSNLSTSPGQAQIYPLCRPVVLRALRRSEGSNFHFFPWTHQSDKSLALLQKGAAEGAVMEAPCGNGVSVTTPLLTAVGEGGWEGMFPTVCNRESCQAFMARIWLSRPNQMDPILPRISTGKWLAN